jgi:hypothetical protein
MDRTLFTPVMVETFRVCKKAYQEAFLQSGSAGDLPRAGSVCKRFMLKALAEINKGKISNIHQLQKFMGSHWPVDKFNSEEGPRAFLFAHKALSQYLAKPYRPQGGLIAGVALKVRARLPHQRVYLEDSFDLIVWYPQERRLELVDFHVSNLKPIDPAWPSATMLVRQFLGERLRSRWPFEKLTLTYCKVDAQGITPVTVNLDDAVCNTHWPDILRTLGEMNTTEDFPSSCNPKCLRCQQDKHIDINQAPSINQATASKLTNLRLVPRSA